MKNRLDVRVDCLGRIQPRDGLRNWQRRTVREVNRYGMGKMADAAVLIFELAVPVSGGLKSERQNERGHQDGCNPVRYSPSLEQPNTPTPMLLRRSFQYNRVYNFCTTSANGGFRPATHRPAGLPFYRALG
ncbi:MAG: hypothetical protein WCD49_12890 [Candidatus Acidiferrales bacterium]